MDNQYNYTKSWFLYVGESSEFSFIPNLLQLNFKNIFNSILNDRHIDFSLISEEHALSFKKDNAKNLILIPQSIMPGTCDESNLLFTSKLNREFGRITFELNISKSNKVNIKLEPKSRYTIPTCNSPFQLYNQKDEPIRIPILNTLKDINVKDKNVFISRIPIGGFDYSILKDAKSVWVAGLESWKKILQFDVHINGCTESLGERELNNPIIKSLYPGEWVKLSHDLVPNESDFKFDEVIQIYQIEYKNTFKSEPGITHFFWKSISAYKNSVQHFPFIKDLYHSSGVGNSFSYFKNEFSFGHYQPFFSLSDWRNYLLNNKTFEESSV